MTISSVVAIGPMIIYFVGGLILIKYSDITVGSIVMFVALLARLYGPVTSFANVSVDITRSFALFERIFKYFEMKPEIMDKTGAINLKQVEGFIKFRQRLFLLQ